MVDITAVLNTLRQANQLKRTARTGWVQRGVPQAESVAAHTYGVTFTALVLAQLVDEPVDLGRLLAMATLHDLPEALTTDIPAPAWRYLPPGIKRGAEHSALQQILGESVFAASFTALWEEMCAHKSVEACLVHDADRLDMYLQAAIYEEQFGNVHLAEFWQTAPAFYFPQAQAIYNALRGNRDSTIP